MDNSYDLVIIGGGSAGLTAAEFARRLGRRVALVEKERLGGDCTWTGCVPSKTLLKAARVAHHMRTADRYGLPAVAPQVELKKVMGHVRAVIAGIYEEESPEALRARGIDVVMGPARFLDSHTLSTGEGRLTARTVLIATGARPYIPPITGLDAVDALTYETVWGLETLPEHLLVVGGGPLGCEMAQAFRRLGAAVTLVTDRARLLPRDDPAASQLLSQVFAAEGIDLRFKARAERVWPAGQKIHLVAGGEELVGDSLLLAAGRRPNVAGLGLEKAGVIYDDQGGIRVDDTLRTSQGHIYAAGDCTGGPQFTHYAGWQAFMAARNALLPGSAQGVRDQVPWTTFTDPEVAHAGLTEAEARDKFGDAEVEICRWPMTQVDRARTEGDGDGFLKVVHRKNGTILGVTAVAGRAGEMIHEWIVALKQGLKVGDLAEAIHIYPTYSIASMEAAAAIRVDHLLSGTSGRILQGLARLMR
jgi:pyruvate/2-oxoglutarate dehydrogenase complex dihydrolipoamide dehydrogenase (E3) component